MVTPTTKKLVEHALCIGIRELWHFVASKKIEFMIGLEVYVKP